MDLNSVAKTIAEENGYRECRVLSDGSIACVKDLIFTRAIILGVTEWGYSRRFCFADRELATQRFRELKGEDDEPEGYTAARPRAYD